VDQDAELTSLLRAWSDGNSQALEALAPLVHRQLRETARRMLANERAADWQPTELVHETYLRLLDWRGIHWKNRAQFFAAVSTMMRRVLVDAARARRAAKRGHSADLIPLDDRVPAPARAIDVVALDDALVELAAIDPRPSQVIELRFFGGFSVAETAEALGVSSRTVINDWNTARAWLSSRLSPATM
jgi:RNA polymerase sigma-70 factor, ECF subfamily